MSSDKLPSLSSINAARASQQARTASVEQVMEMREQARDIAMHIVTQAAVAASAGAVPIPEAIVDEIADTLMTHAVSFLSGLAE